MSIQCPNKSSQAWQDLSNKYGEFNAMTLYTLNNEEIPTLVEAVKLYSKLTSTKQSAQEPKRVSSVVQYQIPSDRSEEEYIASEKTIRDIASRMSDRIGIPIKFESDRTKNYKGKLESETAVINLAYATLDTPIHEILGHPIIRAIKNKIGSSTTTWEEGKAPQLGKIGVGKGLYENLLKELEYGKGKEVLDRIKRDYKYKLQVPNEYQTEFADYYIDNGKYYIYYPVEGDTQEISKQEYEKNIPNNIKYTLEEQQEEAIVELLGLYTASRLDAVKDGKLISLLKRLLKEMKAFMRSLFSKKEVNIDDLPDNMTLGDIADLLAYSNSKLILPGYEVIYTTPDNQQFKTYAEASKHISELAKSVEDVDLSGVSINDIKIDKNNLPSDFKNYYTSNRAEIAFMKNGKYNDEYNNKIQELRDKYAGKFIVVEKSDYGVYPNTTENQNFYNTKEEADNAALDKSIEQYKKEKAINGFIEKNKEYEQSKEIIEEWKKVNNIQYNPEEVYSRGQGFYSALGAYSDFDLELLLQNILNHIEDNIKAGGEFTVSAYTSDVNKEVSHLSNGKLKFVIYPKPKDIKWASPKDVYSGSVWDASKKVSKTKSSELLGVSYTKYPLLSNVYSVSPNLVDIIDNIQYHHNELGINLTFNNFRIEYPNDIPYKTKKIVDSINSILDHKYGKLNKPIINKLINKDSKIYYKVIDIDPALPPPDELSVWDFNTKEEAEAFINSKPENQRHWYKIKTVTKNIGIVPSITKETLKESIQSVSNRTAREIIGKEYVVRVTRPSGGIEISISYNNKKDALERLKEDESSYKDSKVELIEVPKYGKIKEKEYTSKALINTKIAKLKEVAKKYPRSLIRSEVKQPIINNFFTKKFEDELPFQKVRLPDNVIVTPEGSSINGGNRLLGNNIIKYDKITDYSNIPIINEDEEYVVKDITWDSLKGKAFYSPSEKLFIDSTNFEYFLRKKETYYDIVTAGGTHYFFEWLSDLNDRGEMFSFGVKFTRDEDSILVQYDPNTNLRAVLSIAKSRPFLSQDKHFSDIYDAIKILYTKVGDVKINIPELKFIGNASNFLGEENKLPDNVIVTPEGSFELNEAQADQYKEMIDKYGKARATELLIDFIDLNDLRKYNVDPGSKAYNKVRPSDLGKARAELEHKGFAAKDVDDITKIIDLLHTGKITKETYITTMQHSYGIATDSSTRMFEKFEMLRKFVPFEIEMILDDTLPDFGEYDRKTRVIKINPIIASEDTVGHEMGHVLLELMGGMSNTTIRKVRESLKGTDLETEILNTYKDYYSSQQMLDLEVVAAAIGLDSNKIFNNPKLIEQYETWLMRLYRFIKELFGIDRGNVRKLTMMMFQSTPVENNYAKFYEYSKKYDRMLEDLNPAKRKAKKQPRPTLAEEYGQPTEAELDTLESFRNRATELMERKINTYRKSSKIIASKEAIDFLEKIKSAESPEQALYNFLSIAHKSTKEIHLEYKFAVRKAENMRTPVTAKDLNRWKNYIDGFGMINDMLTVLKPELKTLRFKDPDRVKSDKEELFTDKTFAIMQDIIDKRNDIIKYYTTKGEEILLDFLEPHYNLIEIRRKEELEREYNKLATEQKNKETVDEYITRKLVEEKDRLKEWSRRSLKVELLKARDDINILTRWIDTIVDSRDPIVSAMVKAFTTADFNTHRDTIELRNEMVDIIRELEDFYNAKGIGLTDTKKMYDFMLEKNDKGQYTGNILRNVRSEYWKERNDKLKELQNRNATKAEINKFKKEWNKLNIRKFDKVKFREDHLAFLNRLHDQKKISKAEIEEIIYNESLKGTPIYFQAVETQTIIRRPDVREEWNEWMAENVSKYITYISKWDNPEYAKLERILKDTNDPRTKFYNFVTQGIYKYGKAIPYSQRLYYRLPAMEKDTAERMQEGSWGKGIKERVKRAVTRTTSAEETIEEQFTAKAELVNEEGDPTLFMPIYYTNPIQDENGVMLDDKSTDLGMLYFNYFRMAIDYKHKSEILPSMELARYFVTNRRYLKRDSDGHVIKDALDPERKRDITTGGNKSKLAEQLNDWFEAVFYGLRYKDEGLIGGTNINKAKVLDTINKYTAVNMLGLNFVQGIANLALGKATNFIESFGGINYNPKDFAYAEMYYTKNLPLTLGDVGSRKPNSVVNLLNDQFDSLNEYEDGKMKNNTRFKRLFTSDTLFFTSHAGEHMIQSQVLLAMLHNKKAIDSQGNILGNILDFYKAKDGKLIFNDNKNNIVNWTLKDQKDFMFRMKRVLADLHGDYYHNSIPAFQRLALGRWAGLFRKFIVPGFKRRWSGKHEDALRDTTVEGYYLTFGRFAGKFIKDIATMKMDLATEDWSTLTRSEKANIYRTLGDLAFLTAAITLGIIFTNMKGDGDDEDEWLISFGAYQSYRFLNEISFFILPNSFLNIMRSPAASMAIVENLFKFLAQLLDVVDGPFERFDRGPWKGHLKLEKHITNFIPGYKQYYRLRDIDDSVSWWRN